MLDWVDGALDGIVLIIVVAALVLLFAILLPRLYRRLRALIRGEVEILFEPWTWFRYEAGEGTTAGVGEMLLFELRRVQDIHARTLHRIEITNTYRDIPTFTEGLSTDIDLLASEELEGQAGHIATLTGVVLRLLPLLTPRTRMRGSVREFGDTRTLELTLEHYPVLRRPSHGMSRGGRRHLRWGAGRVWRIWHLLFGQRQTLTWRVRNPAATSENLGDDVLEAAYSVYLDLLGDDTFKSWRCFRLFTQGLEHHVRYMDLDRPDDLDRAEQLYRDALGIEPKNQVVSYNLAVIQYMRYRSAETNAEAIELFYSATSAANPQLKARAFAGIANAQTMAVDRYRRGDGTHLGVALGHAEEALRLAPRLDAAHKAYAYANHQMAESLDREIAQLDAAARDPDGADRGATGRRAGLAARAAAHRTRAERSYRGAIRANPSHFIAYNNLANLHLQQAVGLRDADRRGQRRRQRLLQEARRALDDALEINAAFPFIHDNLGNVYVELGEYDHAHRSFLAALRYDGDYPEAHNDIALLLLRPDFARPTGEQDALAKHHEAVDAARRKASGRAGERIDKLCRQFDERYEELRRSGAPLDGVPADTATRHARCTASRPPAPSVTHEIAV